MKIVLCEIKFKSENGVQTNTQYALTWLGVYWHTPRKTSKNFLPEINVGVI